MAGLICKLIGVPFQMGILSGEVLLFYPQASPFLPETKK
jgi:hypothetical protein